MSFFVIDKRFFIISVIFLKSLSKVTFYCLQ